MKSWRTARSRLFRPIVGAALVVSAFALGSPASAQACTYVGGHTSTYSWTSDGNNDCSRIGTNPQVSSEGGNVYWGWKFSYSTYVSSNPGLLVTGSVSCGNC